jgi:hypothetical protein
LPRKKFDPEKANKIWTDYSKNLIDTITKTEKEGVERGLSSFEIERLWQEKVRNLEKKEKSD